MLTLLDDLMVEAEHEGGYERSLFRHWVDEDGDGCDTRREVLIAESEAVPTISGACELADGLWTSPFDSVVESGSGGGLDIDHMVPLKEAWESGAHAWDTATRQRYANDLGYDHALVAVSAASNRSKGASDPAEWTPPNDAVHCMYAAIWIQVKARWRLSVDSAEADTLRRMLAGCGPDMAPESPPLARITTTPTSVAQRQSEADAVDGCHPDYEPCLPNHPGDALNCGDLTAAQKPVTVLVIGHDPYNLDRDGDGQGCTG
ncbi:MAG: HNH endonuclease family protein [bacterium]|nr:HNH endonuclease family protein [bacterium]